MAGAAGRGQLVSALRAIRIVEFSGAGLAGRLTGSLLAEQGADVISIARPNSIALDGLVRSYLSRNKTRRYLDLTAPEGRQEALQLLGNADVAIENFRPGTMERLGLSPQSCAHNTKLIYLRLPGFAARDTNRRCTAAWEGVLGAACGLYTDVNILRQVLGLPPVYTSLPHASVYGAVHGVLAIGLALLAREATGRGDVIEVPLAAAGASAMGSAALRVTPQPSRYELPEWPHLLSRFALPVLRPLLGRLPWSWQRRIEALAEAAVPALMSSYRCADGRLLYIFAVDHDRFPRVLLELLGLWPQLHANGLVQADPYAHGSGTMRTNLNDSTRLSRRWQRRLRADLASCFAKQSAEVWETQLIAAGIPCSVQRDTQEWLHHPFLRGAAIVEQGKDRILGPGSAVWIRKPVALGRPSSGNRANQKNEAPRLAGKLVLDLTSMVAGPVCGRTLAEYGADVIKIDSPHPHHGPRLTCWYGVDVNQGKRSLLLDLAQSEGRLILEHMLCRADVVLHNFSDAACASLRLTSDVLHAAHPHLVVARIGAIRGPLPGPWDARKGYDPVLQAASGIMLRYGDSRTPVHHGIASCVDYLTGYLAAWGIALGLLERRRSDGHGCVAETSLAQAAQLIQLPFSVLEQDRPSPAGPSGQWAWGKHALYRLYRARDGWIFLAAPEACRDRICRILGLAPGDIAGEQLACAMARAIRRIRRAELIETLQDRTIAVFAVEPLDQLPTSPASSPRASLEDGTTIRTVLAYGPDGETIRTLAPTYARAGAAPLLQLAPAPRPGADTRCILDEFGLGEFEIEHLLRDGIASEGYSARLLPD